MGHELLSGSYLLKFYMYTTPTDQETTTILSSNGPVLHSTVNSLWPQTPVKETKCMTKFKLSSKDFGYCSKEFVSPKTSGLRQTFLV